MSISGDAGVTLLETVAVRGGRAPLWPLHLARVRRSATELSVPLPEEIPPPSGGGDHIVRYAFAGGMVFVAGRALDSVASIRLAAVPVEHVGYPHKTDQRNWLDDARAMAIEQGADDALLVNYEGWVVEGSIWAVGWWEAEGLTFPPLTLGGLRSVARRRLGELTPLGDGRLLPGELGGKAVIACNAARGVVVVSHLDGVLLPTDERTAGLQASFWDRTAA